MGQFIKKNILFLMELEGVSINIKWTIRETKSNDNVQIDCINILIQLSITL